MFMFSIACRMLIVLLDGRAGTARHVTSVPMIEGVSVPVAPSTGFVFLEGKRQRQEHRSSVRSGPPPV